MQQKRTKHPSDRGSLTRERCQADRERTRAIIFDLWLFFLQKDRTKPASSCVNTGWWAKQGWDLCTQTSVWSRVQIVIFWSPGSALEIANARQQASIRKAGTRNDTSCTWTETRTGDREFKIIPYRQSLRWSIPAEMNLEPIRSWENSLHLRSRSSRPVSDMITVHLRRAELRPPRR